MGTWRFSPPLPSSITTEETDGKLTIKIEKNAFSTDTAYTVTYDDGSGCSATTKFYIKKNCSGGGGDCDGKITISEQQSRTYVESTGGTLKFSHGGSPTCTVSNVTSIFTDSSPALGAGYTVPVELGNFSTDCTSLTKECNVNWITLGAITQGNQVIGTIDRNTTGNKRTGTIKIMHGNDVKGTITVVQSSCDGHYIITEASGKDEIDSEGGVLNFSHS